MRVEKACEMLKQSQWTNTGGVSSQRESSVAECLGLRNEEAFNQEVPPRRLPPVDINKTVNMTKKVKMVQIYEATSSVPVSNLKK